MHTVADVALPVFSIILAGFLSGRWGLLGQASSEALNKFVYYMALPPVLFLGTARRPLAEVLNGPFIGAFLGAMLIVFLVGMLFGWLLQRREPEVHVLQGLNACFSNTGYLGIPLFIAAFGRDHLAPAILGTIIMSAVMVGLAVILLELARNLGHGARRSLALVARALSRNPLIIAPALGILWAETLGGALLPQPMINFCELLGASAGPCALFAIGLFLAGRPLTAEAGDMVWMVALKLFWQPVLTWLLAEYVFAMDPFWTASAIILAALPTGALTFVVAQQYQVYVEATSAVILVSTIVSVITVSSLLALYAPSV
ncbi:MAG: AEC family transporter [Azospirillum sp.]|nr:AEC family transporter [Azospirillum sp.]